MRLVVDMQPDAERLDPRDQVSADMLSQGVQRLKALAFGGLPGRP